MISGYIRLQQINCLLMTPNQLYSAVTSFGQGRLSVRLNRAMGWIVEQMEA